METFFIPVHLWPAGIGLVAMGNFHFRDLEMTLKGHPRSMVIADSESWYQVPISVLK